MRHAPPSGRGTGLSRTTSLALFAGIVRFRRGGLFDTIHA